MGGFGAAVWFWSGAVQKAIDEAQNSFQGGGGATKRGSNRLLLLNPLIKINKVKPFYQIFLKTASAPAGAIFGAATLPNGL
jgi:hypothetical protein